MYKVVFVDDEEQNLLLMEKIIDWEELGFRVSGMALDGDEGLEMYREIQPDLMLVDIKMDEMDGLSLIRKLREEYRAEDTLSAETIGKTENGGNDTENKKAAG